MQDPALVLRSFPYNDPNFADLVALVNGTEHAKKNPLMAWLWGTAPDAMHRPGFGGFGATPQIRAVDADTA